MKNKKTFRLAAFLLVLILITVTMLSGTFAKYSSEFKGSDTALIAKWDVGFNGSTGGAVTMDLFAHLYDKHILQKDGTDYIIAPGVKGDFTFEVTNSSDVDAEMTFEMALAAESENVPLVFAIDGAATTYSAISALSIAIEGEFGEVAHTNGTKSVKVNWEWPYGSATADLGNDGTDTDLGIGSAAASNRTEYKLIVTATAIQVAPDIE